MSQCVGVPAVPLLDVATLNPRPFGIPARDDDLVTFVPMKAVEAESGVIDVSDVRPWHAVKKGFTPFQDGDVIFAKITPCMENGKFAVARGLKHGRAAGSTEFHVLRPSERLLPSYLLHFMFTRNVRGRAKRSMRGAAGQLRVPPEFFGTIALPLPSIDGQRAIVARIEEQFSRLDAGVAALKRVQAHLKRYRAAVLKAACEGKLVPTEAELARREGRDYETGAELLARILAERRARWSGRGKYQEPAGADTAGMPELPEGWAWATVEQLLIDKLVNGVSIKGTDDFTGIRALRLNAMTDGGFNYEMARRLPLSASDVAGIIIAAGDFFVSRGNGSLHLVGRGSLAQEPPEPTIFPDTMIRARLSDRVRIWVAMLWPSRLVRVQIEGRAKTTAGIYKIAQPQLESICLPVPPLAEQLRIVAEVERRLSVAEGAEAVAEANLRRAGRLRQAVLQRAFGGNA